MKCIDKKGKRLKVNSCSFSSEGDLITAACSD